ncbi:ChaN family lipoprotein [Fundidesulfovibrio butyratiphilus]
MLSAPDLAEKLRAARYVLVGESHPSPCDHLAQARVLQAMTDADAAPAVGLEMVGLDRQPVLDRFNAGEIDVEQLAHDLEWSQRWGFDFALYRPIFETAQRLGLPLYALNAPEGVALKAGRLGLAGLSAQERRGLPKKILPPPEDQMAFLRAVFATHAKQASPGSLRRWEEFQRVQSVWDTTMAHRAVLAAKRSGRPVVILAGGGHVDMGWGVASRLAVLDPKGTRLLVSAWRSGSKPHPGQADVYFPCAASHRGRLGLKLEAVEGGLKVLAVEADSLAQKAALSPGDLLTAASGSALSSVRDLRMAAAKALSEGKPLHLDFLRSGVQNSVSIDMEPAKP